MGAPWLDQARYADSNGYSIDAPRSIWKYRDWVIAAFNADMPFDQFAIDQIAGDLRPGATLAQRIATGFHRNTPINQEGGIDVEQFRIESIVDRVNTTGTVFLGLTIGCASATTTSTTRSASATITGSSPSSTTWTSPSWRSPRRRSWPGASEVRARIDRFHRDLAARHPDLDERERRWEESAVRSHSPGASGDRRPSWRSTCRGRSGRRPSAARWSS